MNKHSTVCTIRNKACRSILLSVTVVAVLVFWSDALAEEALVVEAEHVSAQAAVMMDMESERVLFSKNSSEPMRIASITKIMTAIVAIQYGELDDKVETSENAFGVEGSSIYLKMGETLSLEDMLYGLMLRSGNDAAVAIAEHIGGSEEGFVYLMNEKARELGMENTQFRNPHGLDTHEDHYSTAEDMAKLTAYALQNETFSEIAATERWTAPLEGEDWGRVWHNKNRLLYKYPYADGVKTGYTQRAKRTLVSSATKDDHRFIVVTLNAPDDWNDHIGLYEYGFSAFERKKIAEEGELVAEAPPTEEGVYRYGNSFFYPLLDKERVKKQLELDKNHSTSMSNILRPVGSMHIFVNDEQVGKIPILFYRDHVDTNVQPTFLDRFQDKIRLLFGGFND